MSLISLKSDCRSPNELQSHIAKPKEHSDYNYIPRTYAFSRS